MKSFITLIVFILILSGCANVTFTDSRLSFKYPQNEKIEIKTQLSSQDKGSIRIISVDNFSISLTSADYSIGVGEGCCYYFSGVTLDLNMSDSELENLLNEKFGKIFNLRRIKVDGQDALRFIRANEYVAVSLVETVLMPYEYKNFTNLMISSGKLKMFAPGISADDQEVLDYIESALSNPEFVKILRSVELK